MSVVKQEGLGHFTSASDGNKKGNVFSGSNISVNPTGGRGGRGSCTIGENSFVLWGLDAAEDVLFAHFYFHLPTRMPSQICVFRNATCDNVLFQALQDGSIQVLRSSALFGQNTFANTGATEIAITNPNIYFGATDHHIQIKVKIHATLGEVTIKIDDSEVLTATGLNTYSGTGALSTSQLGWGTAFGTQSPTYGDLFVCSDAGSIFNTFQGDVAVAEVVSPTDGDELQWTRSSGAGTWSSHVDSNPQNGDAEYLKSAANGNRNCFSFPTVSATVGTVLTVKETICFRKEDAAYGAVKLYSRAGDNIDHDQDVEVAAQTYTFPDYIFELDPKDSGSWNVTRVNDTQLGFVDVS